ncbi:hypothetical protein BG004_007650 [Podila humilis]|nr:hypothetical protein BG004_007650 [Podila humilis]
MKSLGQYRTIVALLVLSVLASAFYFTLWSNIDPEKFFGSSTLEDKAFEVANNRILRHSNQPSSSSVVYKHQHQNRRPFPAPVNELRGAAMPPETDEEQHRTPEEQHQRPLPPTNKLSPKKQLSMAKAALKAERQRKKEEKEQRARRKQRLRDEENEPFPSLISTNNARVAALNIRAYNRFCAQDGQGVLEKIRKGEAKLLQLQHTSSDDNNDKYVDFVSYQDWAQYIQNKNTGQEQLEPISPLTRQGGNDDDDDDDDDDVDDEQQEGDQPKNYRFHAAATRRPLFLERPLRGWIVNMTAIRDACDRHKYTSAHCLGFLQRDHSYLMPSRQARKLPNSSQERKKLLQNDSYPPPMNFHIFWKGPVSDKLWMSSHAFLFTQPLDRARLHLWVDSTDLPGGVAEDYEQNEFAKDLVSPAIRPYVTIHAWDQKALEEYAYGPQKKFEKATTTTDDDEDGKGEQKEAPPVALSDEARFLILYKYGGIYLDADVLLLKDMSPFYSLGQEFAYEWSNTEMYNTAVLRLHKNSSVARRILDAAKARAQELEEKELLREGKTASSVVKLEVQELVKDHQALSPSPSSEQRQEQQQGVSLTAEAVAAEAVVVQSHVYKEHEYRPMDTIPFSKDYSNIGNMGTDTKNELDIDNGDIGSNEGDSLFMPTPNSLLDGTIQPAESTISSSSSSSVQGSAAGIMSSISSKARRDHFVKRGEMRPKEIYHPARLRQYLRPEDSRIEGNGLTMMPVAVFDPLWLRVDKAESTTTSTGTLVVDGVQLEKNDVQQEQQQEPEVPPEWQRMMPALVSFPDAFTSKKAVCPGRKLQLQDEAGEDNNDDDDDDVDNEMFMAGPEVFFAGAYAYHWHNNWKQPIEQHSWMGLMRQAYQDFSSGSRPNLYGEWFTDVREGST